MPSSPNAPLALSVICPAFNEAANLVRFPTELVPVLESLGLTYEIVVVDDGSKDDTAKVAADLARPCVSFATTAIKDWAQRSGPASAPRAAN